MNIELLKTLVSVLNALVWPVTVIILFLLLRKLILYAISKGGILHFKVKDIAEITVEPAKGLRPPSAGGETNQLTKDVEEVKSDLPEKLHLDYYFLNHTSFLRKDKQEEFRKRTGVPFDHYDIRIIVDSYYRGALGRVEYVEYILHSAYPKPIQYSHDRKKKFVLKELAYGEFVLMAKVYLKDRSEPVLLQRYITLWDSGPFLG